MNLSGLRQEPVAGCCKYGNKRRVNYWPFQLSPASEEGLRPPHGVKGIVFTFYSKGLSNLQAGFAFCSPSALMGLLADSVTHTADVSYAADGRRPVCSLASNSSQVSEVVKKTKVSVEDIMSCWFVWDPTRAESDIGDLHSLWSTARSPLL